MQRIESLDWQRGLLAVSIMVYHLTGWHHHHPDASEVLGRLGVYGVSMFFVLSGLSMALVYSNFIRDGRSSIAFFVRRIFRIWPLLWLAIAVVTVGDVLVRHNDVNWGLVFLNVTTLFGFVSPNSYINTGAWSIGNEMVYYALTPALIWTYNKQLCLGNAVLAVATAIGAYFAFYAMSADDTLAMQWNLYINPFNNLFLYCAGIAIYYNSCARTHGKLIAPVAFAVAAVIFCFYPVDGDLVNVVTGTNRIVFCVASLLLVIAFYNLTIELPGRLSRALSMLGIVTYGVYLLHPVAHSVLTILPANLGIALSSFQIAILTAVGTIGASLISFRLIEEPLIRIGKRLTALPTGSAAGRPLVSVELPKT